MLNKWLRILSPGVLSIILLLVVIVNSFAMGNKTEGWSLMVIPIAFVAILVILISDILLRVLIKNGALKLWLVQIGLLILAWLIYYINQH